MSFRVYIMLKGFSYLLLIIFFLILGSIKIGTIAACGKLSWSLLDGLIERLFTEYLMLVDPVTNLGLSAESVASYNIGEISRYPQVFLTHVLYSGGSSFKFIWQTDSKRKPNSKVRVNLLWPKFHPPPYFTRKPNLTNFYN